MLTEKSLTEQDYRQAAEDRDREARAVWWFIAGVAAFVVALLCAREVLAQEEPPKPTAIAEQAPPRPGRTINLTDGIRSKIALRIAHILAYHETAMVLIESGWADTLDLCRAVEFDESLTDSLEIGDNGRTVYNVTSERVVVTMDGEEWFIEPRGVLIVSDAKILCSATCGPGLRAWCFIYEDGEYECGCLQCTSPTPCDRTCIIFEDDPGGLPGYP